jgi:hypothetical protein
VVQRRQSPGRVGQQRGEPLHPTEHGDVVDLDTTFEEQFFRPLRDPGRRAAV